MLPLLALLITLPIAGLQAAPPDASVEGAFAAARAHFLAHEAGSATIDSAVALPRGDTAQVQQLRLMLDSAKEIQLGCVLPCAQPADALVYKGKVEMVGATLGLSSEQAARAVSRYLPAGKPRLRPAGAGGAQSAGDKLVESQVLERLLADGRVAGQTRERLGQRALTLADALGKSQVIDENGGGVSAGGSGRARSLSADQLAALNRMQASSSQRLRDLATKPPPPPPIVAPPAKAAPDGLIANAKAYWDRVGEDPKTSEAGRMVAATAVSLFEVFNLNGFENAAFRLAESASDPNATKMQVLKDSGAVAGNAALFAAGLVPAGAVTKISKGVGWVRGLFKAGTLSAVDAERALALEQKIAAGAPLTKDEAVWLGEASKGKADVVFHTTDSKVLAEKIIQRDAAGEIGGRVAATTETHVYAARQHINSAMRQFLSGVKPKDGLVVFQGEAAKLFDPHEVQGMYSAFKRLAGQQTTNGVGDIVITKAFFNPETKTLTVTGARMVTQGETKFIMQSSEAWAKMRRGSRIAFFDVGFTSGSAFFATNSATNGAALEYVLGPIKTD